MSIEENKTLVCRFVDEVQNEHDLSAVDELFSPDYTDHSGMSVPPDREGTKQFLGMFFAAFPDTRAEIHDQIAEADKVATRKTLHGTHQGNFMGIPPTGKEVAFDAIDIFRVVDGKIMDHWTVGDMLGLLQQLGAVPSPGQEGA